MYAKQPEKDIDPMHDMLYEYKGILSVFPDVLKLHEVRSKVGLGYISLCFRSSWGKVNGRVGLYILML